MEEHAIIYAQSYKDFKAELDHELNRAASGFVRIGWLLKQARDTDILKDSPYESVTDFAQAEYGLDKSQVSRFMSIHDRFGDPNDPEKLKGQYEGFGVKKLTMMLSLPESLTEELTPDFTASEIQTLKEEVDEEKKITPLEVMAEEKPADTEEMDDLETILFLIGKDHPDMMAELMQYENFTVNPKAEKDLAILAPAGQKIYVVRPAGKGRINFNVKPSGCTAISVRDNSKTEYSAEDIGEALCGLMNLADDRLKEDRTVKDGKEYWTLLYGSEFPQKAAKSQEVAPVQPKKESKVSVPEKKKSQKDDKKGTKGTKKGTPEKEEIMNAPEEPAEEPEKETEEEKRPAAEEDRPLFDKATLRGYKAGITSDIRILEKLNSEKNYRAMRTKMQGMINILNRIIDAETPEDVDA